MKQEVQAAEVVLKGLPSAKRIAVLLDMGPKACARVSIRYFMLDPPTPPVDPYLAARNQELARLAGRQELQLDEDCARAYAKQVSAVAKLPMRSKSIIRVDNDSE